MADSRRREDEARQTAAQVQSADTAALQSAGTTAQAREQAASQVQAARDAAANLYAQRNGAETAGTAQLPASRLSAQNGTQTGTAGNAVNPYASQAAAQNAQLDTLAGEARRTTQANQLSHSDSSSFQPYLDTWRQNAVRQSEGRVDNAVRQGTQELTRAQAEAEEQYRTQMNQISADEARARDNQALYNAAQGNQGGIGSAQMDAVAINAMNNRNTLNNARNKAAREIRQQVIDLRALGEFQKADAAIEIGNQYLIALKELEQWDQQYNLTVDQFNAQMNQRLMDYLAQVQAQKIETDRWAQQMGIQREQFQYGMNQDELNRQERHDRYKVEDERDNRNFNQAVSQFAESMKLDYAKLDMTREQFAESVRQWWTQFNAQQDQLGKDNAFREKQLEQSASQFAQSLGLDREKFVESAKQWWTQFNAQQDQLGKDNAFREKQLEQSASQFAQSLGLDREKFVETAKQWWTQFGAQQDQQTFNNNVTLRQLANSEGQQSFNNNITLRQLENAENQQRITNARAAQQDAISQAQAAASQAQAARNRLATTGQALLNAGVSIANSPDMLDALGMTAEQSELYRSAATQGLVSSGGKSGASTQDMTRTTAEGMAKNGQWTDTVYNALLRGGYTAQDIALKYGDSDGYKAYMRTKSGGTGTAAGSTTGNSGNAGLRTFESQYTRIAGYLKDGKQEDIVKTLDATWSRMSDRQRERMKSLLNNFGFDYEE